MAKLYAPQIPGTLPAFYENLIKIPFTMNKAVGFDEINGFSLLIKDIQNNQIIDSINLIGLNQDNLSVENGIDIVKFTNFMIDNFTIGNFYKMQLAYIDKANVVGYYSTIGIIKYTGIPEISIEDLNKDTVNYLISNKLIGKYINKTDSSEKIYSYKFIIKDWSGNIFEESEEILHNHQDSQFQNSYVLKKELKENEYYNIIYTVTTINNLVLSTPEYTIVKSSGIYPFVNIVISGTLNRENAYIQLDLSKSDNNFQNGKFFISKASSKDQFSSWDRIYDFELKNSYINEVSYKDFNIEFGEIYQYAVQQYNDNNIESTKILSNLITAHFEHIYLYDGQKQLKIEYNPKISSFKENVLESKINTLGGKYPYFFRNGQVGYKEFPISGLISYLSDDEELFISKQELGLEKEFSLYGTGKNPTTNLSDYNIKAENIFKFKVLEFLNNGKPKIFKSPIENNYLVRLMNSSLSPNDQLGRMLHTFNTTAVEVDELNLENLLKYQIANNKNNFYLSKDFIPHFKTYDLLSVNEKALLDKALIFYLDCRDIKPGTIIKYKKNNSKFDTEIVIGQSSNYIVELQDYDFITDLKINSQGKNIPGFITVGYYIPQDETETIDKFNKISKIKYQSIPLTHNPKEYIKPKPTNEIIKDNQIKINNDIIDLTYTYNFKLEALPGNTNIEVGKNIEVIASIDIYEITYNNSEVESYISKYNFIEFYLKNIEREVK